MTIMKNRKGMSKHLAKEYLYKMPSGSKIHPCRLIVRDGSLMWKHVFLNQNEFTALPTTLKQEFDIIDTAHRLEELNVWVSQDLEPWESITPVAWFDPAIWQLEHGRGVYFNHTSHPTRDLFEQLNDHLKENETLKLVQGGYFADELVFFHRY